MSVSLSNNEKLALIKNMGTMLSAGIPILEIVDSLLEEARGSQRKILLTLKDDLNQGKNISDTFAKFPDAFDPVIINLLKASEAAGTLETTLKDLQVTIKKDMDFNSRVKGALVYPVFVVGVFLVVLIVILTFVIPRIALVFSRLKVTLPLPTKILIGASDIILDYTPFVVAGVFSLVAGCVFLYKTKKKLFLNFLFSLPLLSKIAREIDLTRFTRSLSLLLSSGIPITEALDLSQHVVTKKEISKIIENCKASISGGKKLSEGLKKSKGVIPGMMIRITEAGEKSGTLDASMQDLSEHFDDQVSNTLKTITSLLEPIMLVVIGFLVGGMMLAIITPIYGLIGQIQGR